MLKKLFLLAWILMTISVKPMEQSEFSFKKLTEGDLPIVYEWFQDPVVRHWWPTPTQEEDFFKDFLVRIRSKNTVAYLILLNSVPLGYIQYYALDRVKDSWLPDLPEHTLGIDQFIGRAECRGKGYGVLFIKEFIAYLYEQVNKNLSAVIVDPEPENTIAIRCYEKVGFKKVGEYQRRSGPALLMRYDI